MVCPKCASPVSATDRFCENCGILLSGAARKHVEQSATQRLAVVSDVGRRHPINEDAGAVAFGAEGTVVLVVADGVSTSIGSASASEAAVEAVMAALLSASADAAMAEAVRGVVAAADQAVLALPGGKEDGPETTVVVALCRGDRLAVGWVGDSRAYLISLDGEERLTVDDSWVEDVVRRGEMSREQAIVDRRSHFVTQVLGMRDQALDVHIIERSLPEDGVLLLCSDGLWNFFQGDGEMASALRQCATDDALSLCRCLVDVANERGGHDNVTVAALIPALATPAPS